MKVDVQASVGLMGSQLGGGPHLTAQYHHSLEHSVQANFPGNHCINCMCHSTENLYRYDASFDFARECQMLCVALQWVSLSPLRLWHRLHCIHCPHRADRLDVKPGLLACTSCQVGQH